MSVLAELTVYQCDNCPAVIVVRDHDSREKFDLEWHEGGRDYCGTCRGLPKIAEAINREKSLVQQAIDSFLVRHAATMEKETAKEWPDYVN